MSSSLRIRLAAWLLLPLSLFVAVSATLSWRNAATVADYVQDHDLLASAKVLSDRLIWDGDAVQASVPPAALALFASPAREQVFLSVTAADGRPLAGMPGFPLPARRLLQGPDRAQWYDARIEGRPVRAVLTERAMYDVAGAQAITIAVAKTTGSRDQMVRTLWWPTVEYLLAALALALVLTPLALTWELRPVMRLGRQLARRDPLHLDFAVDARSLHSELRPVGETINQFVRELKAHSEAQRRFIADAAHQLRTPLALQASQIEFVRYAREHRTDWDNRRADMAWVRAEPALLDALIANLLDNALRYTLEGGRVTVGVRCVGPQVELTVDDNGPGIPAEALERVFERFYRLAGDSEGTGLGLAIVREVARTCGAAVTLQANPGEAHGLRVCVAFAAQEKPPQA